MLPQGQPRKSLDFCKLVFKEEFDGKNNQTENKHENADPVDAVHVFNEPGFRTVRVGFFDVEIFRYLPEYTHKKTAS